MASDAKIRELAERYCAIFQSGLVDGLTVARDALIAAFDEPRTVPDVKDLRERLNVVLRETLDSALFGMNTRERILDAILPHVAPRTGNDADNWQGKHEALLGMVRAAMEEVRQRYQINGSDSWPRPASATSITGGPAFRALIAAVEPSAPKPKFAVGQVVRWSGCLHEVGSNEQMGDHSTYTVVLKCGTRLGESQLRPLTDAEIGPRDEAGRG